MWLLFWTRTSEITKASNNVGIQLLFVILNLKMMMLKMCEYFDSKNRNFSFCSPKKITAQLFEISLCDFPSKRGTIDEEPHTKKNFISSVPIRYRKLFNKTTKKTVYEGRNNEKLLEE
jgi:hypothetical protein